MIKVLFMLLFLGLGALFVWRGAVRGKRYTWLYSLTRSVALLLTVVVAVLLSALTAWIASGVIYNVVENLAVFETVGDFLAEFPSTTGVIRALVAMVLAPLLFYGYFFGLKALFDLFATLITKGIVKGAKMKTLSERGLQRAMVAEKKRGKVPKHRELWVKRPNTAGKLLGGLCGFLLFVAVMAPIVGFLNVGNAALSVVAPFMKDNKVVTVAADVVDGASNNLGARIIRTCGGRQIFSSMTTYQTEKHTVSLQKEADFLSSLGRGVLLVSEDSISDREAAEGLREAAEKFDKTSLVPAVLPEFMSVANARWEQGRTFYGIKKISLGGNLEAFNDSMLNLFATSDYTTVKQDMTLVLTLFANAVENGAFRGDNTGFAFLTNEELICSMMVEITANRHTAPMIGDLMEYGLDLLGSKLDGPAVTPDHSEEERSLYEQIVEETYDMILSVHNMNLTSSSQNREAFRDGYLELFGNHGIALSSASANALAMETNTIYTGVGISRSTIEEMYASMTLTLTDSSTYEVRPDMSEKEESKFEDLPESEPVDITKASLEDFTFDHAKITDPNKEGQLLGKVFCGTVAIADSIMDGRFVAAACIRDLGPLLDSLSQCASVGKDNTAILLAYIFQSERVYGEVGLTLAEVTEIVEYINDNVGTVNSDGSVNTYEVLLNTVANAIHVIQLSATGETGFAENMNFLMRDLNPVTSQLLSKLLSTNVIKNYGVSQLSANASSGLFSNMFDKLAKAREAGMDDLSFQAETNAAVNLTELIMNNRGNTSNMFGADGVTGVSAGTFVGNMLQAEVVSDTMREIVFEDGTGIPTMDPLSQNVTLSEAETQALQSAMTQNWISLSDEEKNDKETKQTYQSIGALLGKEVNFTYNTVTLN